MRNTESIHAVGDIYKDLGWSLALAQLQRAGMSAGSDPGLCYRCGEEMGRVSVACIS